jgi:hypothetical protein
MIKNIALCVFGNTPIKNDISLSEKDYRIETFAVSDKCQYTSMGLTANQKRQYEIYHKNNFDICIALQCEDVHLLNNLNFKHEIDNKIYYLNNVFYDNSYKKGISPSGFYANSLVFDRLCEFIFNKIDSSWDMTDATRFFYHIKSIKIPMVHITR